MKMLENKFFTEIKDFVFDLLKESLPSNIIYHNYDHTLSVVQAANEIGKAEKIGKEDMELLLIASWFHDTGYTKSVKNHEDESKVIVQAYLDAKGFEPEKTERVLSLIEATKMPQKPGNELEKVICDADMAHMGSADYKEKGNLLRQEWEMSCDKKFSDIDWLEEGNRFFSEHKYFTNFAFTNFSKQKTANWLRVQKDLRKAVAKNEEQQLKLQVKNEELKRKKEKDSRPDRGIETMYRVTLRNHIKLSDIADTKANILLSVSAIILSIALSTLFPKLDKPDNAYLIYPTLMFFGNDRSYDDFLNTFNAS